MNADFLLNSYDFDLPQELIAQYPAKERDASRLLVLNRKKLTKNDLGLQHAQFSDLLAFLPREALLVANNSQVFPARLTGHRATGGKVEFLLLTPLPLLLQHCEKGKNNFCSAEATGLLRCGAKTHRGDSFAFGNNLTVTILEIGQFGQKTVRLEWQGDLAQIFASVGHIPLPPYIRRPDEFTDKQRYQTIYANPDKNGSVAAPTAGLHFTAEMRQKLAQAGIAWTEVTLYVGYGTFSPVREEDIRLHRMHKEYVEISAECAKAVLQAKAQGRPVIAVGTTSARALEGMFKAQNTISAWSGWTDIFLYPSQTFHIIDGLLTNFHLPKSSLLMLVAAFVGRERILATYKEAVKQGYRFFSYGDAMLIV